MLAGDKVGGNGLKSAANPTAVELRTLHIAHQMRDLNSEPALVRVA